MEKNKDYELGKRVRDSLSKFPKYRNLTTFLLPEAYNKMINEDVDGTVFTGGKYYDSKSNSTFDIIFNNQDISELAKIDHNITPIVPYFSPLTISNPQEYFLSLNKKFPYVNKFFLGSLGNKPRLFTLTESSVEDVNKSKIFIPGSYIILD